MSCGPDAGTLLARALAAHAARCGLAVAVTLDDSARWASATFTGGRHALSLTGPAGPAFDAWLGALPGVELPLRGHLVADLSVSPADSKGVQVEVLTVEER